MIKIAWFLSVFDAENVPSYIVAPDAWRAMLIGPSLMAISQFSGTFCVVTYAKTIFTDSGSNFNPNTSAIILASLQICGTYCTSMLIEKLGRKFLLGLSCGRFSTNVDTR